MMQSQILVRISTSRIRQRLQNFFSAKGRFSARTMRALEVLER